ncbi:MAG: hypothetical protein CM1200mP30_05850 [Pseudomonadota bacterium]|nr:MAG: hypothetical protein CM1200mP30_05850 [Pseudomonadota bacterium]
MDTRRAGSSHTLRVDIDYGVAEANTTFGKIGVKVFGATLGKILEDPGKKGL